MLEACKVVRYGAGLGHAILDVEWRNRRARDGVVQGLAKERVRVGVVNNGVGS
jgi:hypothetical protein